jgi:hypothetical protein
MNNTFELQRFGLLLKRKWLEFGKIYLVTLAVAFGVMLIAYTLAFWPLFRSPEMFSSDRVFFRIPFFIIFGFLFITAVSSNYFAHLGQKPKTIIDLLIPASTFEKFLAGVFFTAMLTTVSFLVLFYLTDFVFIAKLRNAIESVGKTPAHADIPYFFTQPLPEFLSFFYVVPFFISSVFLLGSVYFDKFHYIKTALSVMVFVGVWAYIVFNAGDFITRDTHAVQGAGPDIIRNDPMYISLSVGFVILLFTLVFWAITYVRLKEKEV